MVFGLSETEGDGVLTGLLSSRQPDGSVGPLHRGLQVRGECPQPLPLRVCCPLLSDGGSAFRAAPGLSLGSGSAAWRATPTGW